MPYKSDRPGAYIRPEHNRTRKLSDAEKDQIRDLYTLPDWSQRRLAAEYGVSRRLITFILDPEKLERHNAAAAERRKDGRYYDPDKHAEYIRKHRHHKHQLDQDGLLLEEES